MTTKQQNAGTATNSVGQEVELGRPHQPTPAERKPHDKDAEIDMNPGEPARPFVGGDSEPKDKKAAKKR